MKSPFVAALAALLAVVVSPLPSSGADRDAPAAAEAHRRGIEAARAGRRRDAVESLRRAVEQDYGNVTYHLSYGQILEAENPAAALFQYQLAFKYAIVDSADTNPGLEFLRRLLVTRCADLAVPVQDAEQSSNLLRLAIALNPDDGRLHLNLAGVLFLGGEYRAALREARAAQALGLDDGTVRLNIAAAHLQLGETAAAEREIRAAISADEFDVTPTLQTLRSDASETRWVRFRRAFGAARVDQWIAESTKGKVETALERFRAGDRRRAVEIAREAVEADTLAAYAAVHLGDMLLSLAETSAAEAAYRLAADRRPENVLSAPRLGDLLWADGRFREAADVYVPYLSRPDIGDARLGEIVRRAADALVKAGDRPKALETLEAWLRRHPRADGSFEAQVKLAEILQGVMGRQAEADRAFRALVADNPLRAEAYRRLYAYLVERTRSAEAKSIAREGLVRFDLAIEGRPRDYALHREKAAVLELLERRDEAAAAVMEGARRSGNYRAAANDLAALGAETEALSILRLWITESGEQPEPLLYYAWIAARAGLDLDTALGYVRKVETVAGRTPPVIRTLARVQLARGLHREAALLAEEVLSGGSDVPYASTFHRIAAEAYRVLEDPVKADAHLDAARRLGGLEEF